LVMAAIVPPAVYFLSRHLYRKGPWFILDRKTGVLELPRTGKTFDISKEVINFQECYGEYCRHYEIDNCTELNLLVKREADKIERYPIIGMSSCGASRKIIRRISEITEIPLVRCTWWDHTQWVKWSKEHRRE